MKTTFKPIPETGTPFPKTEYELRQRKVHDAIARAGLDALLVTHHGHLQYLTGYEGELGAYFGPFPLILIPGQEPVIVVREYDEAAVRAYGCVEDVATYRHRRDWVKVCGDILRKHGLQGRKVGMELDAWGLAPMDVSLLQAELPDLKIVDGTPVIRAVKAIKTELELAAMRKAMSITDGVALQTFYRSLRDGITEAEMAAAVEKAVAEAGASLRIAVLAFGERNRLPHPKRSTYPLRNNEPAMTELGAVINGYACGVCRGAVLGRHPEAEALYARSLEAMEATVAAIKPGVPASTVDAAARKAVELTLGPKALRHRTGYSTGPQWAAGGRGNLSMEPGGADILQPGMTFHMPLHLFGESGILFGCSEHILVTDTGVEVLSRTPRALYRV